ncbi:hypothetical protein EDB89DRAFT_2247129 [Lactarius sanguifluus]|nr:hypothetical protein EDB89DRAFT_2247129 [Lactarius sanguifluus]
MRMLIPLHLPITTDSLSTMPSKHFFRNLKQRACKSRPAMSGDQAPLPAQGTAVVPDPTWQIDTRDDIAMGAIQTSLEVKQYRRECEIVMGKLARIAGIIVDVCEKYNLSKEELPTTLQNILSSLRRTRELDRIERVLKKCSKGKGIRGMLLRKDLLTNIRQCDVELSNVLQAFQAELGLDIRFALIVQRREITTASGPIEVTPSIPKEPNQPIVRPGHFGILDHPDVITLARALDLGDVSNQMALGMTSPFNLSVEAVEGHNHQ